MSLYLYGLISFIITFLLQLIGIFLIERKKKSNKQLNIEQEYKNNMKTILKIIIALIIAVVIGIITLYVIGIAILIGLREGH